MSGKELVAMISALPETEQEYPVVWQTQYDGHADRTHAGSAKVENGRILLHKQVEKPAVAQPWLRSKA